MHIARYVCSTTETFWGVKTIKIYEPVDKDQPNIYLLDDIVHLLDFIEFCI